jgi:apolipoprotein N-acyltransferase
MAAMRAVEQGRYLVRAANTGISGVVDPYGRVEFATELFVEGAWTADVRLIEGKTIYGVYGDWVVWASLLLAAASIISTGTKATKATKVTKGTRTAD